MFDKKYIKDRPARPATALEKRDKPFYIEKSCPKCDCDLKPIFKMVDPQISDDEVWWDEWACPNFCEKKVYLDLTKEELDVLEAAQKQVASLAADPIALQELASQLGLKLDMNQIAGFPTLKQPTKSSLKDDKYTITSNLWSLTPQAKVLN